MTVEELIEKLKYMPIDAEIQCECSACNYRTDADMVVNVSADKVVIS